MTFDELMVKTLAVFPNAVLSDDGLGNIIIEPGYYIVDNGGVEEYSPQS